MNTCLNCNNETANLKFCSNSCAATYNNKLFPKKKLNRKCNKCENIVKSYRHRLCEYHHNEYKETKYINKTIGEYRQLSSVKGKHPSWVNSHIRNFARSWFKHLTKLPCAHCGYDKHVELAHIKAISEFKDTDLLSDVNSADNIIQLCPNCHWEFDNISR